MLRVLEAVCQEASEDHLGVALIRHGSSRYEQKKVAASGYCGRCNKGGTAFVRERPLQ